MLSESSRLSVIVAESSTTAALGGESAGGTGTPELDVTYVKLDQLGGSMGGVIPSKVSLRARPG